MNQRLLSCIALFAICCAPVGPGARAETGEQHPDGAVNLIANGSFEEGLSGWSLEGPADRFSIDAAEATHGKQSLRVDARGKKEELPMQFNVSRQLNLKPATRYLLKADIRRTPSYEGHISVIVLEKDGLNPGWNLHRCGLRPARNNEFDQWESFELQFTTSRRHEHAHVRTYNSDYTDAVVWYDNLQLFEIGPELKGESGPTLKATASLETRDAQVTVFVNQKPVNGDTVTLSQGVNVLAIRAKATGSNPGVKFRLLHHPETDGRWRAARPVETVDVAAILTEPAGHDDSIGLMDVPEEGSRKDSPAEEDKWKEPGYDDRGWAMAKASPDGFMWSPASGQEEVFFRQIVLWSENHYSALPCLQPKVREWGFSRDSIETLFHTLYSPVGFDLDAYEFVLDVPRGFSLLEEEHTDRSAGGPLNRRARRVSVEDVKRDGFPYTRYSFSFEPLFVRAAGVQCTLIPLVLNEYDGAAETRFYYRRLASGNLTELDQTLPVRVLPPINGRLPKRVLISQYISVPWLTFVGENGGKLFPRHLDAHVRQSLDAGFNCWFIGAWQAGREAGGGSVYDLVIERGGFVVVNYNSYPIRGYLFKNTALGRWMHADPSAQAMFFNNTGSWTDRGQFCPSYVTGEGKAAFKEAVKADIGEMLHGRAGSQYAGLPKATFYWTNWEEVPWIEAGMGYRAAVTGNGSYCFCDRCKEAFMAVVKLPEATDLADNDIWERYKGAWNAFRYQLDGRVNEVVRDACNELGMQYIVYTGVHDRQFWSACAGKIDLFFPGSPGGAAADAFEQSRMDDHMAFFRTQTGMPRVLGQLFAASFPVNSRGNWTNEGWDKEGFHNARSLKPQILRVVASYHGGVDLNSSLERCAGAHYYIGEATRLIHDYEHLFWDGERADSLAASDEVKYPNLLVLKKGGERLVLVFNEAARPLALTLRNKELLPGQTATVVGSAEAIADPAEFKLTVEPEDVAVIHIK